jgi:acyl carrier protein
MVTTEEIMAELASIIREKAPTTEGLEISMKTLLKEDLGLDSLRLVQIMVGIEDKYQLEFDVEDLDPRAFECIADLVALTEKTIGKVASS